MKLCTVCNSEFDPKHPSCQVCSDWCRRKRAVMQTMKYKATTAEVHTLTCQNCRKTFHHIDKNRKLCGIGCISAFSARKRREAKRTLNQRKLLDSKLLENDGL